jgi:hypothetical protein
MTTRGTQLAQLNAALAPLGYQVGFGVQVEAAYPDFSAYDQTTMSYSDGAHYFATYEAAHAAYRQAAQAYPDVLNQTHPLAEPVLLSRTRQFSTAAALVADVRYHLAKVRNGGEEPEDDYVDADADAVLDGRVEYDAARAQDGLAPYRYHED